MATCSKIEWTECTWKPVTRCTKISAGCQNCNAERMAGRLQAMGNPSYVKGFDLTIHERLLDLPLHWKSRSGIRQLHERHVSQGTAFQFHPQGLRCHDKASQHRFPGAIICSRQRQFHLHNQPAAFGVAGRDGSSVQAYGALGYGEPEAGSAGCSLPCILDSEEGPE